VGRIFGTLDPFFEGGEIMGRNVANEGFMRALLKRDPFDAYHFFVPGLRLAKRLEARLASEFPKIHARGAFMVRERAEVFAALAANDYHCFHLSDCINNPAWLAAARNGAGRETFPITSVTHSLSYARYPQAFLAHLWRGTTVRDCVAATSRAAVATVKAYYAALRQGYVLDPGRFPEPTVARVPLGVDADALAAPDKAERQSARQALGLLQGQTAMLVFGRLSHHSKMDLLPLFRMVQRLLTLGADASALHLLIGGFGEEGERMLGVARELAGNLGFGLTISVSPDEAKKRELFAAADVFLSPSDNPQETFGLSVVEAGAMGLPVVASDYDGYRDIVEHGVTGLLVPVTGPETTSDVDAASPLVFDTASHLRLAQRTAVDVAAMAGAVKALMDDPQRARDMGRAGALRVGREFTWQAVIERFLSLWDELWARPVDPQAAACTRHPLMPDYAGVFAGHPSRLLAGDDLLTATATGNAVYRGRDHVLIYEGLGSEISVEALRRLLFEARKPLSVDDLARALEDAFGFSAERSRSLILWAMKHDLLKKAGEAG